jgi:hypothetical protein
LNRCCDLRSWQHRLPGPEPAHPHYTKLPQKERIWICAALE